MTRLVAGILIFFGIHSVSMLALGWRNRMAERLGSRAWQGIYSVVSAVGLYLIIAGYGAARQVAEVLYVPPTWFRYVAALLMLPAFTLALSSVLPGRIQARAKHPLLAATKLWAVAHLLTNGSVADLLLFGSFLLWAIAVRISLKHRPARPIKTLPPSRANDAIAVVGGLALYALFILWLHARWLGVSPLPIG
jgi:uncharacterized membrane protein